MAYAIVRPGIDDAAAIAALAQHSFATTFQGLYRQQDLDAFLDGAMSARVYAEQLADPAFHFRVARTDDGLAGFVKLGRCTLPLPDAEPPAADAIELKQLYLAADAQGTGLADRLIGWAHETARGLAHQAIYLSVWVDNHRAKRFYARHGYVEIGRNPFRVGDQIDDDRIWKREV